MVLVQGPDSENRFPGLWFPVQAEPESPCAQATLCDIRSFWVALSICVSQVPRGLPPCRQAFYGTEQALSPFPTSSAFCSFITSPSAILATGKWCNGEHRLFLPVLTPSAGLLSTCFIHQLAYVLVPICVCWLILSCAPPSTPPCHLLTCFPRFTYCLRQLPSSPPICSSSSPFLLLLSCLPVLLWERGRPGKAD